VQIYYLGFVLAITSFSFLMPSQIDILRRRWNLMPKKQPLSAEKAQYTFTRVKDTHEENGQKFITLFGRLTIQNSLESKSAWVEIEEVKWEQATDKLKDMPDAMYMYYISENIFKKLTEISEVRHEDLYFLTPVYMAREFKQLGC
jgi:hypothetical protein